MRYVRQGSRDGVSAAEAVAAWDRHRFLPSVLRDVTHVDTSTTLLGTPVRTPLAVAPSTMQRGLHPDGEVAMARGVAAAGSLLVVSSNAGSTFEEIERAGAPGGCRSTSPPSGRRRCPCSSGPSPPARAPWCSRWTPRWSATKYDGGGPTVWDLAAPGWLRVNFPEGYGSGPGDEKATDLGPQDVEWLATATGLPVVAKGVLRPQDARRCLDAGATAVWVSNHGGRQLDPVAATADCLEAVVAEVGGAAEVYVDGGVRSARQAWSRSPWAPGGCSWVVCPCTPWRWTGPAACSGCSPSWSRSWWRPCASPAPPGPRPSPATCSPA